MSAGTLYGLRGSGPKPKTVTTDSRDQAIDKRLPDDVLLISVDGGQTWQEESAFLEEHPEFGGAR